MHKSKKTANPVKIITYLAGVLLTALGINILLRSMLGAGAWDTVTHNLSVLAGITLGTASFSINVVIMAFIILYNRKLKFLLVILPIIGIALTIDFWDIIVFGGYYPGSWWLRIIFYFGGTFILTLGLALMVITRFPAMVFDELTLSLMRLFKIDSFFITRTIIELFAIALATVFGFAAGIGFGAVNVGSFILALILGPILGFQLTWLGRLFNTGLT
ncbi:MAG: hypothetical protein EA375_03015 [Acholeplasmataceae bacterium]|nr:MAG: hypothetical protein EA375_03015 [Acholeplasmataceae bacterium]